MTFDPQFTNTLEAILTEAANRPHESTGFETPIQLSDRVTQISVAIRSSLRRLNELAPQEAMRAVVASLKRDSIKCQTLLTSQLSPEDFVRGIFLSLHPDTSPHQEPSSSSSNGKDDISQVCNFQPSQHTQPSPTTELTQPTAEVGESQQIADPTNCSSLSSSTVQPASTITKPRNFTLFLPSELKQYLDSHDISSHGSREELIARCQAKERELIAQRNSAREVLAAKTSPQTEEASTPKEVAILDELPTEARSVSSDGPPPTESQFKRLFNRFLLHQPC